MKHICVLGQEEEIPIDDVNIAAASTALRYFNLLLPVLTKQSRRFHKQENIMREPANMLLQPIPVDPRFPLAGRPLRINLPRAKELLGRGAI